MSRHIIPGRDKGKRTIVNQSKLTCPDCGHSEILNMPDDACLWFHECSACHRLLKPKPRGLLRILLLRVGTLPTQAGSIRQRRHQPGLTRATRKFSEFRVGLTQINPLLDCRLCLQLLQGLQFPHSSVDSGGEPRCKTIQLH